METTKFIEWKTGSESAIWSYFLREQGTHNSAKCKLCSKILKTAGGSTKGLHTHLNTIHQTKCEKRTSQPKQRRKITACIEPKFDNTLPAVLARMTAVDGIPFKVFCTSYDLRESLKARGFQNIPKSPNTVRSLVLGYYGKIKDKLKSELQSVQSVCLTFDEWTSKRNRRYMNINVHYSESETKSKFCSLGMVRICGSMPAEKCIAILKTKLQEFGLSLEKDVVCITTDSASIMVKVGSLISTYHQLCFAHGIQLAVVDVLYNKNQHSDQILSEVADDSSDDDDSDVELTDPEEDIEETPRNDFDVSHLNIKPIVDKIRKIVGIFRHSPTKNDSVLQKYVEERGGQDKALLLDTKTRWNSLIYMIERFVELKDCIQKSLIDIKSKVVVTDSEFEQASTLLSILSPIKVTVEALCRRDANLLTCDTALKFMLNKLQNQNNPLAHEITNALIIRIEERRTTTSGVLQYLHNGKQSVADGNTNIFLVPTGSCIKKFIVDYLILRRVNEVESEMISELPTIASTSNIPLNYLEISYSEEDISGGTQENLADELQRSITRSLIPIENRLCNDSISNNLNLLTAVGKEMKMFEGSGHRGPHLQRVYKDLLAIPPTSVESERVFSAAGIVVSKLRTRIGDNSVDALCFLKSYFKNNLKDDL